MAYNRSGTILTRKTHVLTNSHIPSDSTVSIAGLSQRKMVEVVSLLRTGFAGAT